MPVIGYNLNIPAANNNPSQDQPKMQTNTNAINTLLSLDHYTFSDNAAGRHKQVSLANESAPGIPANTNGVLYANAVSGQSQPFWQNALGSFQIPIIGASSITGNGYIRMGGVLFQWGSTTAVQSANSTTISYPIAFTTVFTVQATIQTDDNSTIRFSILNPAGTASFDTTQTNTSHLRSLYWFAVGI